MNKIVINGFPHSGTSLLRRIFGGQEGVEEVVHEINMIGDWRVTGQNHIVWKFTGLPILIYPKEYKRIIIIRNPWDIFGSLYRRFGAELYSIHHHQVKDYLQFATVFEQSKDNDNTLCIRYEWLMEDLINIIRVMEWAGIKQPLICVNSKGDYVANPAGSHFLTEPPRTDHLEFRTWQVNQPLKDQTGKSAKYCPAAISEELYSYEIIKTIGYEYTEIKD